MEFSQPRTNNGSKIEGIWLIQPTLFEDKRGFFMESWSQRKMNRLLGYSNNFVQDNHSRSSYGVLRGLHYQIDPNAQGKLIRCIVGKIYDVAVDIRLNSKTFCNWVGVELSDQNKQQLWIPPGFAHGFLALTEHVEIIYKVTDYWNKSSERSIRWDDPSLSIDWPKIDSDFLISEKDEKANLITDLSENDFFL